MNRSWLVPIVVWIPMLDSDELPVTRVAEPLAKRYADAGATP